MKLKFWFIVKIALNQNTSFDLHKKDTQTYIIYIQ